MFLEIFFFFWNFFVYSLQGNAMNTIIKNIEKKLVKKLTDFYGLDDDEDDFVTTVNEIKKQKPIFRLRTSKISKNSRIGVINAWKEFTEKDSKRLKKSKKNINQKNVIKPKNIKPKNIKSKNVIKQKNLSNSSNSMVNMDNFKFEVCNILFFVQFLSVFVFFVNLD